jgi:hypothetical protein
VSIKKKTGLCPICGEEKLLSSDHLPPRKIFRSPRPSNLITIRICHDCNNGNSQNDEIFKIALAIMVVGNDAPIEPLFNSAMRSIQHNKKIGRIIKENSKETYLVSPTGIIMDKGVGVKLVPEMILPFIEVVKRITKGLYYHHYQEFIGYNAELKVRFYKQFTKEMHEILKIGVINKIGSGQFSYCYARSLADQCYDTSIWLFEFHKRYWVTCASRTPIQV